VLLGRRGDEFFAIGASCTHGNKGRSPNAWSWTTRCGVPGPGTRGPRQYHELYERMHRGDPGPRGGSTATGSSARARAKRLW